MSAEYSVEEVRERFEAWYPGSGIEDGDTSAKVAARVAFQAAYAERIKADEVAVGRLGQYLKSQAGFRCLNDEARRDVASGFLSVAYARQPAQASQVAQGESAWLERLKDPATVHALMLRGVIAIPSIRSMVDLRGEVPNGEEVQLLRIAELQEQLAAQPRAVPAERVVDGWVLVPVEPTDAMCDAGDLPDTATAYDIYKAMLAAATSPGESA